MVNSIQQFISAGVEKLEKTMINFSAEPTKIAEMVYGVTDSVTELGLSIIAEELEFHDETLRNSAIRKKEWYIVRRDETSLLTSLGTVRYKKTLFKHKETGKCEYLLDRTMELDKHTRMTEDAEAKILEEAVESSYRKGGINVSIGREEVSKQTVKNKIHALDFPEAETKAEKKSIPYLYIDCDEDHVALQFMEEKGDIETGKNRRVMPKLVYVYEGIENDGKRRKLTGARYFGGMYEGSKGVEALWKEVWGYIEESYDTEAFKKIYINGDGAGWIRTGCRYIAGSRFVLDKFHMSKYIIQATSHLWDSVEDAQAMIYRAMAKRSKRMAEESFEKILEVTETESRRRAVEDARDYILGNWAGIMEQRKNRGNQAGCSAEGHVSHIYADRMSSRPLGWSRNGVDKMARLRIYHANKGDMLKLVRYQKEEKAAGAEEEVIFTSTEMFLEEKRQRKALGELAGVKIYSIPYPQVKKIANFKNHILGL